jgi:hypothetical protein
MFAPFSTNYYFVVARYFKREQAKVAVLLDSSCQFQETTSYLNLGRVERSSSCHQQRRARGRWAGAPL